MTRSSGLLVLSLATLAACGDGGGGGAKTFTLTVSRSGAGTGSVSGTGITCGADCTEAFASGTQVVLTASPDAGSTFASWAGCDSTEGAACTVTMSAARTVTASFDVVSSTFTLHYHRPASDYAGWTAEISAGSAATSVAASSTDGWGAVYTFEVTQGANTLTFKLSNGGADDPAGTLTVDLSGYTRVAYAVQGYGQAIPRELPAVPSGPDQAVLYYLRADVAYTGWGLHLWGDQAENTSWGVPLAYEGVDADLGAGFVIDLPRTSSAGGCPAGNVCFIVHKGDAKDPGPDITDWKLSTLGNVVFVLTGSAEVSAVPRAYGAVEIAGAAAHLVSPGIVMWNVNEAGATSFELRHSPTADVRVEGGDVVGGAMIPLALRTEAVPAEVAARVPQLDADLGWKAYDVAAASLGDIPAALKGQLVAVARDAGGATLKATQVQAPFAIDDLFATEAPLGVTWSGGVPTVSVWAPTAQSVQLQVFDTDEGKSLLDTIDLTEGALGVWSTTGPGTWSGKYYRFVVEVYHWQTRHVETFTVTDPWAVSLSTDSAYAQMVDLSDPTLKPDGWDALAKPALAAPEDIVLYESHIRDFSASDPTTPLERRGKYLGFVTPQGQGRSDGLEHLYELAQAGVTHVHLLPAFDIATVEEDPANRVDIDQPFADLCAKNAAVPAATCGEYAGMTVREAYQSNAADADGQAAIAGWMRQLDGFNWGYDPWHYGVPEGSYASSAEGTARILEFREMVKGLADVGMRVVMDVVYNHTNASGNSPKSVLDKVVPGYYHRRDDATGFVWTTTCCQNTATEHRMMQRLMVDTAVRWARDYKVDGFRFDLMGFHLRENMVELQAALQGLTVPGDGVDGSAIYVYGEGWDFGEVQTNRIGVNAAQQNIGDTGIGVFNDRIRDGLRGGSAFDNPVATPTDPLTIRQKQGFSSGLYVDPNESRTAADLPGDQEKLLNQTDWIKLGLAGNLKAFPLTTALQTPPAFRTGDKVGYNGAKAAYTTDPQENINYASAHDNQTLWDIQQYKAPAAWTQADRVRGYGLALDAVLLGQGIPFFHMGDELLRSKSMDKNSYDSGDWFNRVDWTGTSNGWRSGLPIIEGDATTRSGWENLIRGIFSNPNTAVAAADIQAAYDHFREMLAVRRSSPLFRLRTGAEVIKRVHFLNGGSAQQPGVIVMTISDDECAGADVDVDREGVVVIINSDKVARTMAVPGGAGAVLHPELASSVDPVVRTAAVSGTDFTVPARTTAVFVVPNGGVAGSGLPCNPFAP